jgi:hypothetical protein
MDKNLTQIFVLLFLINISIIGYYYYVYYDQKENHNKHINDYLNQINQDKKYESEFNFKDLNHQKSSEPENHFHDSFMKNNNQVLGWRYYYLKNQSNYLVPNDDNFSGTSARPFLDSLFLEKY